ncbi:hypothetical protein ACTXT7_011948 [Hymenolepis weldensis]
MKINFEKSKIEPAMYFDALLTKTKEPGRIWTQAAVQLFNSLEPTDAVLPPPICGGTATWLTTGHPHRLGESDISDFMNPELGLAFIAYPEALAQIPGASILSFCIFAFLYTLGLDSQMHIVTSYELLGMGFLKHDRLVPIKGHRIEIQC